MRQRTVNLSQDQQFSVMPGVTSLLEKMPGIPEEDAGAIVMEIMTKLTPAMAQSELAVVNVLTQEAKLYRSDPEAYSAMTFQTQYQVLALTSSPPENLGDLPDEIVAALQIENIPEASEDWVGFVQQIDADRIAALLGMSLDEIGQMMRHRFQKNGRWRGTFLDLLLALAFEAKLYEQGHPSTRQSVYSEIIEQLLTDLTASTA